MQLSTHESCCGIMILNRVGSTANTTIAKDKLMLLEDTLSGRRTPGGNRLRGGQLVTMTLTNRQLASKAMKEVFLPGIFKMGWRLVTRFKNPNSGNIVNVFHYTTNKRIAKLHNKYNPANVGNQK